VAREVIADMVRHGHITTEPGNGGYYLGENVLPTIMGNAPPTPEAGKYADGVRAQVEQAIQVAENARSSPSAGYHVLEAAIDGLVKAIETLLQTEARP
jgi:hypothetical protein